MSLIYNESEITSASYNPSLLSSLKYNGVEVLDGWVEYEFPNENAYLNGPGGMYGFTSSRSLEDTGGTVFHGEGRMLNNTQSDCMRASTLGNKWVTANFVLPDDWGDARLASFRTDGTAVSSTILPSWINVYVSPIPEQISSSKQIVRAKQLSSSTTPPISDSYFVDNFSSDFNPKSTCKTIRFRFLHGSTSSTRKTLRSGNFYIKFLIKKSALKTWANNYNVLLPSNIT